MKGTRHSAEQIICKLKIAEQPIAQGKTVVDVYRVSLVAAAVRQDAGRGSEASDSAGEGKYLTQETSGGGRAGKSHAHGHCRVNIPSPERRRRAVNVLQDRYRASQRLVCRVAEQHRSTLRHAGKVVDIEENKLRQRLWEIAAGHIRWGRRMAHRLLRREGLTVNLKWVQRLWREAGLQRPTPPKRKRALPADGSVSRFRGEYPHQVWAMDFQCDATADGRRLKFLNVTDEQSSLCRAVSETGEQALQGQGRGDGAGGAHQPLPGTGVHPSDNGPEEFIAQALRDWCEASTTTRTAYIEPGSPWDNGFAEFFNGRFRDEFLDTELFTTAAEAQLLTVRWRWEYITFRPHSALQAHTPLEAAQQGVAA
jgi:putative transposase